MKTKIIERKLGKEKLFGQAFHDENIIEIDPRQTPSEYLDTLIHEKLHLIFPNWSEEKVTKTANELSVFLWDINYRQVKL